MKVALYYRVSTVEQTTDPQRLELLEYCRRRGWDKITEFSDQISGSKFSRSGLDAMMLGVRKGRFGAVIVVKIDRLGRSLAHLAQVLGEMNDHGTALIATSQGIDTSVANPAAKLQMHVLMAVAEFEREIIRERTKAGLAVAKARLEKVGRRLGRKRIAWTAEQRKIIETWQGTTSRLAAALGCSVGTAHAAICKSKELYQGEI